MTELRFFVAGLPKPAGSKRAFIVRAQGKPDRVAVTDASGKAGKDWRHELMHEARAAFGARPNFTGPLVVEMDFWLPRPKAHHGQHGVKPTAPGWPTTRPDVLKLARNVEDALTGILYGDDAQIVSEHLTKNYADGGLPIGVTVRVRSLAVAADVREVG